MPGIIATFFASSLLLDSEQQQEEYQFTDNCKRSWAIVPRNTLTGIIMLPTATRLAALAWKTGQVWHTHHQSL
jgi:hypothetical protein